MFAYNPLRQLSPTVGLNPYEFRCQIGHRDMEVSVQGARAAYRGEVVPRYEFWLPPFGGCAVYYWDRPRSTD